MKYQISTLNLNILKFKWDDAEGPQLFISIKCNFKHALKV